MNTPIIAFYGKAQQSQSIVRKLLEESGFTVAEVGSVTTNGVDLVAIKNGRHYSIEVKSACKTKRAWIIKKVTAPCDFVAIVMPTQDVHFDRIADHEKLTSKNGNRMITQLVHLYQLLKDAPVEGVV